MRFPRRVPTVLDQRLRVAITALLASSCEAAGEFTYVRIGSMRPAGLDRKVAPPNSDHALGVREPEVVDLAVPDHAGEGIGVVAGDLGGLGQGQGPRPISAAKEPLVAAKTPYAWPAGRDRLSPIQPYFNFGRELIARVSRFFDVQSCRGA